MESKKTASSSMPNSFVWRTTINDDMVPFNATTDNRAEMGQKDLKKDKQFDEKQPQNFSGKIVRSNLNSRKANDASSFLNGEMVYCHHLGEYVQIKKKDVESVGDKAEEIVTFRCTVSKGKEETINENNPEPQTPKEVMLAPKDISKFIQVSVMIQTDTRYQTDQIVSDQQQEMMTVKVNIYDKVSTILSRACKGSDRDMGGNCLVSTNKKVVEKPEEISFQKLFVKNDQIFSLTFAGEGRVEPIRWMRFKEWNQGDYFHMSENNWDAMIFRPKRDILFLGFGIWCNQKGKDTQYIVQWRIGKGGEDFQSEEIEYEMVHEDREPEKLWHIFDIRDLKHKPIPVAEGTDIHILAKATNSGENCHSYYGYSGHPEYYSKFENQEFDFDTANSEFNQNSTDDDWGNFPFILYV